MLRRIVMKSRCLRLISIRHRFWFIRNRNKEYRGQIYFLYPIVRCHSTKAAPYVNNPFIQNKSVPFIPLFIMAILDITPQWYSYFGKQSI